MSFSQENGYIPASIETIMNNLMDQINIQFGTSYTTESFEGTNFYKYFYALAQRVQKNEVKTSEIFLKLQQYITLVNERISRPVNTSPGIIEKLAAEGFIASVKPMIDADAGKISVCILVDDGERATGQVEITDFANLTSSSNDTITIGSTAFVAQTGAVTPGDATFQALTSNELTAQSLANQVNANATASALVKAVAEGSIVKLTARNGGVAGNSIGLAYESHGSAGATISGSTLTGGEDNPEYPTTKTELCNLLSQITVAGCVTQGTESEAVVLSNGQSFDFKYFKPDYFPTLLRLTLTTSENNQNLILSPDEVRQKLISNINEKYQLGKNFEPQRYFTVLDAPWTSQVLLEYSIDGGVNWESSVYDSEFNHLLTYGLADIEIVEV